MTKIKNDEQPSPGVVLAGQVAGPLTPANLTATPANQSITLDWEATMVPFPIKSTNLMGRLLPRTLPQLS